VKVENRNKISNTIPVIIGMVLIGTDKALNTKNKRIGKNPYKVSFLLIFFDCSHLNGAYLLYIWPMTGIGQTAHQFLALKGKYITTIAIHHPIHMTVIAGFKMPIWVPNNASNIKYILDNNKIIFIFQKKSNLVTNAVTFIDLFKELKSKFLIAT